MRDAQCFWTGFQLLAHKDGRHKETFNNCYISTGDNYTNLPTLITFLAVVVRPAQVPIVDNRTSGWTVVWTFGGVLAVIADEVIVEIYGAQVDNPTPIDSLFIAELMITL